MKEDYTRIFEHEHMHSQDTNKQAWCLTSRSHTQAYRVQLVLVRGHLRAQLSAQRLGRSSHLGVHEFIVQRGGHERKHALGRGLKLARLV
jgi:hypothetical protein